MTPTNEALREFYHAVKQANESTNGLDTFEIAVLEALNELVSTGKATASLAAVQSSVDEAAQAITTLDPTQWANWAVYLLESLDGDLAASPGWDEEKQIRMQQKFLVAMRFQIAMRLEEGEW